ncbi:uncharacterized protein LOC143027934 [Oratosquilla oratoria]|uniref:uncharacterized protein LOC143027934 n=1 Tax=Oratosquilla oratoria TaxID=337810 RepID=UPI003F75A627
MAAQTWTQPLAADREDGLRKEEPVVLSQHRRLASPLKTSIPPPTRPQDHPKTSSSNALDVVRQATLPCLQGSAGDGHLFKSKSWLQTQVEKRSQACQQSGHLDLAGLALPFFPSAVLDFDCSNVHRVSLQDNNLNTIPGIMLLHLPHMTWLDLRFNAMELLPPEIGNLTQLQVLLLSGNNLKTLPMTLGKLMDLMTLQVSDNPLEFPPRVVVQTGTRAIITYLASMLLKKTATTGEEEEEDERESLVQHSECLGCEGCRGRGKGDEDDDVITHNCCKKGQGNSNGDVPNPCVQRYEYSSPPILEMIHLDIHPEEDPVNSYRDSLGYASTPTSPCLLTPDWDLPGRPQYYSSWLGEGVPRDEDKDHERKVEEEGECQCLCDSKEPSSERFLTEFEKRRNSREPLHGCSSRNPEHRHRRQHVLLPQPSFSSSTFVSTMGRVEETKEDDEDSLEGDVGEGCRRPSQGKSPRKECLRQTSHETAISSLPLVCIRLPSPDGRLPSSAKGNNHDGENELNKEGDNVTTIFAPSMDMKSAATSDQVRRGSRNAHGRRSCNRRFSRVPSCPPKLVTAADVRQRAREQRRRQKRRHEASEVAHHVQRIKSNESLRSWREELRQRQLERFGLPVASYQSSVVDAPFGIDMDTLPAQLHHKIQERRRDHGKQKLSRSDIIKTMSMEQVSVGMRACVEQLESSSSSSLSSNSVAHAATIVRQLHHLRRQLQRLRVNAVI